MSPVSSVVYAFLNRASRQIVSGSRFFKISSAIISPMAGPCLNPCPEPPPTIHAFVVHRMPVDDEIAVRRLLVLAHASFYQGRVSKGREAEGDVFSNLLQCLLTDHALAIGRIEGRPARIVGDLESAAIAAGYAVTKASPVIGPYRQMLIRETIIAAGRAEEENILLSRLY